MTNIMEIRRERLFAADRDRGGRPELAALRELARRLSIHLHVGSLRHQAPRRARRQPLLLIDRDRRDRRPLRQDPHVRRRSGERESYRESRNFRPGELAVTADLPWGRLGLTICYDLRCRVYRALPKAQRDAGDPLGVHAADRRGALAHIGAGTQR